MTVIESGHGQDDADIYIGKGGFHGIASFENGNIGIQSIIQDGISLCGKPHVRDRIGVMIVLPCRVYNEIRFKIIEYGKNQIVKDIQKALFGCFGGKGNINRCAEGIRASEFIGKPGTWIEGSPVLMNRNEQRIRIVPVDFLGAVTVMTVSIDDGNPFVPVMFPDIFDHDCFDIHITESPVSVDNRHGMVTGRTNQCKCIVDFTVEDFLSRRDGAAGGNKV